MIYRGIEYQVRASLGRNEWVALIYFPGKIDGRATVSKFTGTREAAAGAARRKIGNWAKRTEAEGTAAATSRSEDRAATTRQHVSHYRQAAAPGWELVLAPNNMVAISQSARRGRHQVHRPR